MRPSVKSGFLIVVCLILLGTSCHKQLTLRNHTDRDVNVEITSTGIWKEGIERRHTRVVKLPARGTIRTSFMLMPDFEQDSPPVDLRLRVPELGLEAYVSPRELKEKSAKYSKRFQYIDIYNAQVKFSGPSAWDKFVMSPVFPYFFWIAPFTPFLIGLCYEGVRWLRKRRSEATAYSA